jgi:hypothetical protein
LRWTLARLAVCLALGASSAACSGRQPALAPASHAAAPVDGGVHTGAGITAYRRNTLAFLSDGSDGAPVRLAAHVVGFSQLEVITELPSSGFSAGPLAAAPALAPGLSRMPLGMAVADVDGDGRADVFVSDPSGNWVAEAQADGTFNGVAPGGELASLPSTSEPHFEPTAAGLVLAGAGAWDFFATTRQAPGTPWPAPVTSPEGSLVNVTSPVCVTLPSGAGLDFVCPTNWRRYGVQFFSYDLSKIAAGAVPDPAGISYAFVPPYVVPFDSFDHPARILLPGCDRTIAGVGIFEGDVGTVPRRIERLSVSDSAYSISELETPFDVITFGVVPGANADAIVGVVGSSSSGYVFAAYRATGCNDWAFLGSVPIDFDWRPAPAPGFGGPGAVVPKTNGVQVLGWRLQETAGTSTASYRFLHYDGYTVRVWTVGVSDGTTSSGSFDVAQFTLHSDRNDLIAP